ncbi:MAG: potassium transporter TrkG [Ornithinimicrobium sp.]
MNGRAFFGHPARLVTVAFALAVVIGTALLMLPISRTPGTVADLMVASFTTVSAVCVTGLVTVDTGSYWTPFGQAVILVLIHIGGLGVMAMATLLTLTVRGRLGLRTTMVAQAETHTSALGDVRRVLVRVVLMMATIESIVAVVLILRFRFGYAQSWSQAAWNGVFHSGSAFNNAGFALFSDSLTGFVADPVIIVTICAAVVAGGLGFPVLRELRHRWSSPSSWTLHTRITVYGSALLLVIGTVLFWVFETSSGGTLESAGPGGQFFGSLAGGVFPRTAGFNSVDYAVIKDETEAVTTGLMFIGGGSAGTAGGIKVSTFFILGFVIWSEIRGEQDVTVGGRRISESVQRQALTVALLAVGLVAVSIVLTMMVTDLPAIDVSFEVVSAFATVGLSTGITADLPPTAQVVLMALMFIGRVGSITVASAIAVNTRHRHYRLPEERPIVG